MKFNAQQIHYIAIGTYLTKTPIFMLKLYIKDLLPQKFKNIINRTLFGQPMDEISYILRYFNDIAGSNFVMIDVGAHCGSSLIPFAKKKWTIYAFEPNQENRKVLLKRIKNYRNIHVDSRAVSSESNKVLPFYTSNVSSGISGLSSFHESHIKMGEVSTIRLDDFCLQNEIAKINFLKIDTEGYDLMVLKSYDWRGLLHPDVIIAEFENKKTTPLGYTLHDLVSFLNKLDYKAIISEWFPIVQYGKRHKWKRFTLNAEEVVNKSAWGNIIAAKKENIDKLMSTLPKKFFKTNQ